MSFFKGLFTFTTFFIVLCIPIRNKMIFEHITDYFSPLLETAIEKSVGTFNKGSKKAKNFGTKLFHNIEPIGGENNNSSDETEELEEYHHSDKETLNKIFR